MNDLFVGVDVGTTHLKVGMFDAHGELLAMSQGDCAPDFHADGRIEVVPELWWAVFEKAFEECLDRSGRSNIRAIGVSSQAQTCVLLDAAGKALGPAVSWLDTRGDAHAKPQDPSGHDYYAHVGWAEPMPLLAACKLRRYGERPDAWQKVERLVFADGYLMFRLTGVCAVSRNLAAMSGLYSMVHGDWWTPALETARTPARVLPMLRDMAEPVGVLSADLARKWSLNQVPVVAGANDQTAAALGAGLHEPGQAALGIGTALAVYKVIEASAPALAWKPLRGPYPEGLQYRLGLCHTGGAAVDWVRKVLGPTESWEDFTAEALAVSPGCDGLRLYPDLTGEGGKLVGLRLAHGRGHVFRAVLEGTACAVRELLDLLSVEGTVRATGGGSANEGWMQMIADVTGRCIETVPMRQTGLLGAALMAGHGARLFTGLLERVRLLRRPGRPFRPREKNRRAYEDVYRDYAVLKAERPARGSG